MTALRLRDENKRGALILARNQQEIKERVISGPTMVPFIPFGRPELPTSAAARPRPRMFAG